jgi:hypothetical protein
MRKQVTKRAQPVRVLGCARGHFSETDAGIELASGSTVAGLPAYGNGVITAAATPGWVRRPATQTTARPFPGLGSQCGAGIVGATATVP